MDVDRPVRRRDEEDNAGNVSYLKSMTTDANILEGLKADSIFGRIMRYIVNLSFG